MSLKSLTDVKGVKQINLVKSVLESLTHQEQQGLYQALNIDPKTLHKKTEQDFIKEENDPEIARTRYKYYLMKRLDNIEKIKDFLQRA
jgi:hypothetical protein